MGWKQNVGFGDHIHVKPCPMVHVHKAKQVNGILECSCNEDTYLLSWWNSINSFTITASLKTNEQWSSNNNTTHYCVYTLQYKSLPDPVLEKEIRGK